MQRLFSLIFLLLITLSANASEVDYFKMQYKALLKNTIAQKNSHIKLDDIEVDILFVPSKIKTYLPVKRKQIKLQLPDKLNRFFGKLVIPTYIGNKRFNVIVNNRIYSEVVIASKSVKKYDIFSDKNVAKKRVDLSRIPFGYLTGTQSVLGREAVISISEGAVLLSRMISTPTIAKRGNEVQLVAKVDSVTVICKGKILRDAKKDDIVWVENLDSKKRLRGVLIDNNTVLIK